MGKSGARGRLRPCGGTEFAVAIDNYCAHFRHCFTLFEHCHHVTRDVDADASAQGVILELNHASGFSVFNHITAVI